jgi:predicted DNA-binding transcriptional regulator YafY
VRLLRLLSLLSTRQSWTNREFAERMEVNERTVRRDGARLLEPASRRR